MHERSREPENRRRHEPDENSLKIADHDRMAPHCPDEKQRSPHLHRDVSARKGQAARFEGLRQCGGKNQSKQHQNQQREPHRQFFGIQPIGDPRRKDPHPPDREHQQQRLHRSERREMPDERMRELSDREDKNEIEEQFNKTYLSVLVPAVAPQQPAMPRC